MSRRYKDFLCIPSTPIHTWCPMINIPHQSGTLATLINLHRHIVITQSPYLTLGFTLGVVYSMGLDKCVTWIHFYNIIQNYLDALQILRVLFLFFHLPSFLGPLETTDLLFVSVFLLFPEYHEVEIRKPFQIGFFHFIIGTGSPSQAFYGLIVHFLLA